MCVCVDAGGYLEPRKIKKLELRHELRAHVPTVLGSELCSRKYSKNTHRMQYLVAGMIPGTAEDGAAAAAAAAAAAVAAAFCKMLSRTRINISNPTPETCAFTSPWGAVARNRSSSFSVWSPNEDRLEKVAMSVLSGALR